LGEGARLLNLLARERHKIPNKLVKHIELVSEHNVLKHSLLQHDR
jgi:hypothetical protein